MKNTVQRAVVFLLGTTLLSGCFSKNPTNDIRQVLTQSKFAKDRFINKSYYDDRPLAQLINMPTYSQLTDSFFLSKPTAIQVYAVGEILYNLPDSLKQYYLESDDVELYFNLRDTTDNILDKRIQNMNYRFAFTGDSAYKKQGIDFNGVKTTKDGYTIEIKLPWTALNIGAPKDKAFINFDIGIGDNDDGFMQKAKLAWCSKSDNMKKDVTNYGHLLFTRKTSVLGKDDKCIHSIYGTPKIDTAIEKLWSSIPEYRISNIVYGFVKDRFDLSATVQSCWDEKNLYFLFKVTDSRQKFITLKKIKERGIFVDYGWIENDHGEKIWEMNAKNSKYAGGVLRNQKVDTVLNLKAGRYKVKYVSDESHSYNDWTDDPPNTPFYGIVLYQKK